LAEILFSRYPTRTLRRLYQNRPRLALKRYFGDDFQEIACITLCIRCWWCRYWDFLITYHRASCEELMKWSIQDGAKSIDSESLWGSRKPMGPVSPLGIRIPHRNWLCGCDGCESLSSSWTFTSITSTWTSIEWRFKWSQLYIRCLFHVRLFCAQFTHNTLYRTVTPFHRNLNLMNAWTNRGKGPIAIATRYFKLWMWHTPAFHLRWLGTL
jgi:hypothetical protein